MDVDLLTLATLREDLASLHKAGFSERYPGAFLLALGFLSTSEISRKGLQKARARRAKDGDIDQTASFHFAARPTHDAKQTHPLAGCAFYLKPSRDSNGLEVGRSKACDITVPDDGVSETHCRIEVQDQGVVVVDLGSTNGTAVNLARLEAHIPKLLADEDILSVGRYSFQMFTSPTFYSEMQPLAYDDLLGE